MSYFILCFVYGRIAIDNSFTRMPGKYKIEKEEDELIVCFFRSVPLKRWLYL